MTQWAASQWFAFLYYIWYSTTVNWDYMRYIVSFLIAIGLIILFVILLLRAIFGGGGDGTSPERNVNLADYERTNVVMRFIIDGPVVANELHGQVRVEVARDENKLQLIRGYQGEVTRQENFNSNSSAYGNFLRAIDLLGYTKGSTSDTLQDYRGYCPTGNRYIFQIAEGDEIKQQFWATSCTDGEGSFNGETNSVITVFQAQIPGYQALTSGAGVN